MLVITRVVHRYLGRRFELPVSRRTLGPRLATRTFSSSADIPIRAFVDITAEHEHEITGAIELLDTKIVGIDHIHIPGLIVHSHALRSFELPSAGTGGTKGACIRIRTTSHRGGTPEHAQRHHDTQHASDPQHPTPSTHQDHPLLEQPTRTPPAHGQHKTAAGTPPATPLRSESAPTAREKSSRASRPACRAILPRQRELAARGRRSQRERERERRVSDADASYNGPAITTRTLKHVIPQRNHAKNNSLSKNEQVPLPRSPSKTCWCRPRRPTLTQSYVRPKTQRNDRRWRQHTTSDPTCQVPLIKRSGGFHSLSIGSA